MGSGTYVPIWEEDRTRLDSRRVSALALDGLVIAPVLIPLALVLGSLDWRAWLIYTACSLTYFHVMETHSGQTVGKRVFDLRVVRQEDAGPAGAKAISIRTALRLLDAFPAVYAVGAIAVVATGKRRQRLGDLAAATVVTRASARPYVPARPSPLVTIYPVLWIGAAIGIALWIGPADNSFLARVDKLCEEADTRTNALGPTPPLDAQIQIRTNLLRQISSLWVPNDEARRAQIRIFQVLNTDAWFAAKTLEGYRRSGATAEYQHNTAMLLESSRLHSRLLSDQFGLEHC